MGRKKFNILVFLVLLSIAATLASEVRCQKWMVTPSRASVFVGWLENAEVVQIRLPSGNVVTYGGEKLKNVVEELKEWEKYAGKKAAKDARARNDKE